MGSSKSFILLLAALAGSSAAQSSVVSLFLPFFDPQPLVASIVSVDASATAFHIACPDGTKSEECGVGPGFSIKAGPSTLEIHSTQSLSEATEGFTQIGLYNVDASCTVSGTVATCLGSATSVGGNGETTQTSSTQLSEVITGTPLAVTITAGLEKLTGAAPGSSKTAGMPRVTQQAVLAGVAAVVGGAMMI